MADDDIIYDDEGNAYDPRDVGVAYPTH